MLCSLDVRCARLLWDLQEITIRGMILHVRCRVVFGGELPTDSGVHVMEDLPSGN
jgi:hypothetical protein